MSEDPAFNASGPLTDFSTGDLLGFYAHGVFPMAEARDDPRIFLIQPEQRGIIPLNDFHIPTRLRRTVRTEPFQVRLNSDFAAVVDACASAAPGREDTWINAPIRQLYMELHAMGHAHSIECWQGENLMGGLYGVSLGGAFFGESMFSRARDASKIALVHLVARLKRSGFALLDSQFLTSHLQQFGALEIPQADYLQRLRPVLPLTPDMDRLSAPMNGEEAVSWALGTI